MKTKKTQIIATGIILSAIVSFFDIMYAIHLAVLTNTYCNYIIISRQRKRLTPSPRNEAISNTPPF